MEFFVTLHVIAFHQWSCSRVESECTADGTPGWVCPALTSALSRIVNSVSCKAEGTARLPLPPDCFCARVMGHAHVSTRSCPSGLWTRDLAEVTVKVSLQEYCLSYADNSVLKITPFKAQWLLYVPPSVTCCPHSAFKYNSI